MPIDDPRTATPTEIDEALSHIGACHQVAVDPQSACEVTDLELSTVAYWSIGPGDRWWCACTAANHTCPRGPTEGPEGQWEARGVHVAHYAARMLAGDDFPPIVVIDLGEEVRNPDPDPEPSTIGQRYLVEDGFHRISAALLARRTRIPAVVVSTAQTTEETPV